MKFLAQKQIQEKDLAHGIGNEQRLGGEVDDDQVVAQILAHEDTDGHEHALDADAIATLVWLTAWIVDVLVDRLDNVLHQFSFVLVVFGRRVH